MKTQQRAASWRLPGETKTKNLKNVGKLLVIVLFHKFKISALRILLRI
jgi:hypothetical protein